MKIKSIQKDHKEIYLGDYVKKGNSFATCNPYAICFVYTPDGKYVVKGMSNECMNYVEENFPVCIYYYSFWHKGEQRGSWLFNGVGLYWQERGVDDDYNRLKRKEFKLSDNVGNTVMSVRRIPRRWIPVYDKYVKS